MYKWHIVARNCLMIYFFVSTFLRMITEYSYTYTMWGCPFHHKSSPKFPNGVASLGILVGWRDAVLGDWANHLISRIATTRKDGKTSWQDVSLMTGIMINDGESTTNGRFQVSSRCYRHYLLHISRFRIWKNGVTFYIDIIIWHTVIICVCVSFV